jgi:uncharacterized protein (DUF1499 family)
VNRINDGSSNLELTPHENNHSYTIFKNDTELLLVSLHNCEVVTPELRLTCSESSVIRRREEQARTQIGEMTRTDLVGKRVGTEV